MSKQQRMVVAWSPHDTSIFAVGADNLRLFETTTTSSTSATAHSGDNYGSTHSSNNSISGSGYHHYYNNDTMDEGSGGDPSMTTQRKRSFRLIKINAQITQLKCMEWYPFASKPLLIAAGMGSGKILLSDFEDQRTRMVREFLPKYSRPCNAVAWNPVLPNQLAAGFEKVRSDFCTLVWDLNTSSASSSATSVSAMGANANGESLDGSRMSGDTSDIVDGNIAVGANSMMLSSSRSKSTLGGGGGRDGSGSGGGAGGSTPGMSSSGSGGGVVRTFTEKPLHELSNSEATMALSWVPFQPTCLATGTGFKWLRVYDLRTKNSPSSSPMSIVAHNKAVLGVVFDEHRPHMLATYTDGTQEPVKVWDIRRLDSSTGPVMSLYPNSKTLSQVSWCPSKPGILVTASVEEKWISLWDVITPETDGSNHIKKPFRRRYTSDPLSAFSWQYVPSSPAPLRHYGFAGNNKMNNNGTASASNDITAAAFPNRLLTASIGGAIEDISVHDSMPISVSSYGSIAFGCGELVFGGSVHASGLGTAVSARQALENNKEIQDGEDISNEMYKLAKMGYSVALPKNLKLFGNSSTRHRQLRNLWLWVDQVESLRRVQAARVSQSRVSSNMNTNTVNASGPLGGWPLDPAALAVAGVKNLLSKTPDSPTSRNSQQLESTQSTLSDIVSVMKTDPILGCHYYDGLGRRLALLACNWDPDNGQNNIRSASGSSSAGGQFQESVLGSRGNLSFHRSNSGVWNSQKQFDDEESMGSRAWNEGGRYELRNILSKCEAEGDYARAAALAVFHGDLNSAVTLLQKGANTLSQMQHLNGSNAQAYSPDVLQLVAMAVAGYSPSSGNTGGQSLWSNMCQQLLKREEILSQKQARYLHAMLSFLCATTSSNPINLNPGRPSPVPPRRGNNRRAWGSVDSLSLLANAKPLAAGVYAPILNDTSLPLSDRVAFACRYLAPSDLRAFITLHEEDCEQFGRLEGLMITGLNAGGIRLLQKYLDMTGDVQTLALLAARLPSTLVAEATLLENWIIIYQDLLNQWQLFHERARFDVGRSQLEDVLNGFASFVRSQEGEDGQTEHGTVVSSSLNSIPPQLYVRCNFCNTSLSLANLLRLGGSHSSWLNRAKPKLTCCPSCRKPLPQCALCLLPFGSLNPYFELAHRRSKQTADTVNNLVNSAMDSGIAFEDPTGGKSDNEKLSQLSSIPFVEWFTWCQSCKHGGHAHHLADWFKSHEVCPVTDCDCKCQQMDRPVMHNDKQNEILGQQQAAVTAAALRRNVVGKKIQQDLPNGFKRPGVVKAFQQSMNMQQHSSQPPSASSTSSLRMFSTTARPNSSASGFASPFTLSGPGATSMSTPLGSTHNVSGTNSGVNSNGSGSGNDGMSMTIPLSSKLDQLESDKNAFKFI